ncbi:hypothetical protein [Thermaurantiacus sp.]
MRAVIALPLLLAPLLLIACARTAPPATGIPAEDFAGLSAVINRGPDVALALIGPATLDRREGPARHLQFANQRCVLDLYYYPPAGGGTPVAQYADARLPDGRDIQAGECLSQLRKVRPSP